MYSAFRESVQTISPFNMNSTIQLFKELGRPEQATELLRYYVDSRNADPKFFDLDNYHFRGEISDPDVIQAFNWVFR